VTTRDTTHRTPVLTDTALASSAGLVGSATMISRLLGLARDQVFAYLFGANNAMDAFYVAFRIPNLFRDLFAEGAMNAAFVPTFTRQLTRYGKDQAWKLANNVINTLAISTGLLVIIGIVSAGPLITFLASDYASVPGKLELTALLTKITLPFLTLIAIAAAFMGMLNSLQRFFIPALSPAMFNISTIFCAFALVPVMPKFGLAPITAIAIGTLVGGLGQLVIQWPALRREGYRYRPVLNLGDQPLRDVLILMGPGILGVAATQINLLVNLILATGEGTGAVSWLNYSFRLIYLPIGLFGVSIATVALPVISKHAALEKLSNVRSTVSNGLRLMLVLNIPAAVGLIVIALPIVQLIFERGNFMPSDTAATAAALIFYSPGLIGYSAVKIIAPTFYALRDSRTPVLISVGTMIFNITINMILVRVIGYKGLALGTSIAALLNASVLFWLLRNRLGGLEGMLIGRTLLKTLIASAIMGLTAAVVSQQLELLFPGTDFVLQLIRILITIASGLISLGVTARILKIQELNGVVHLLLAKFQTRRTD
jgi:putative peptidoglycan lipid II flippase